MGEIIQTSDTLHCNHVDSWQEIICRNFFGLEIIPKNSHKEFYGLNQNSGIADIQISFISSEGQNVVRSKREIRKSSDDFFLLCFQRSGNMKIIQDDRSTLLGPSDWSICDSTRPFVLAIPDNHDLILMKIPRKKISDRLTLPEIMTAQTISGKKGLGRITQVFIRMVWEELNGSGNGLPTQFDQTIIELLSSCLNERFHHSNYTSRSHAVKLMELKSIINEELRNPELCSDMIADAANISTRYLHMLFRQEDKTVSQYVRDLRLQGCKKSLENSSLKNLSISDICFSWGFNSSSHFCKLFRKKFEMSPREFRSQARAGHLDNNFSI